MQIYGCINFYLSAIRVKPQPLKLLIFKVFGGQSCLMIAWLFDQVTEEYESFQDSKSIFRISDFKIFPIILWNIILVYYRFNSYFKGKSPLFFNLRFLLLFSKRRLSPGICLAICHLRVRLVAHKVVAYKKNYTEILVYLHEGLKARTVICWETFFL